MKTDAPEPRAPQTASSATRLLCVLYLLEAAIGSIVFGLYKISAFPPSAWTGSSFGPAIAAGAIVALLCVFALVRSLRDAASELRVAFATNIISLAIAFGLTEMALRFIARSTAEGTEVAGVTIRPTWPATVSRSREALQLEASRAETYIIYDSELGWTVGPNRRSADGIYASSFEGIRSEHQGTKYASDKAIQRVALIGDSNAFSLEVGFTDSWGYHLGQVLGNNVQVLNFGVDGYGIDQTYLRYQRDVRPWKPQVVVLGLIQHDLMRTMAVYPFVSLGWAGFLVKPRFDIESGHLKVLNHPLPSPKEILSAPTPGSLPFIEFDPGYMSQDWNWRFEHGPLLLQFLTSVSPRWPQQISLGNADVETLNIGLLRELIVSAERDGAATVLVYLPQWVGSDRLAKETLQRSGLPYLDMTECVLRVPADRRRTPSGNHYTGLGNQAIARCTARAVSCALRRSSCV